MSILNEEWRDVSGFEGLYQVSNLGRVRSCDRYTSHKTGTQFLRSQLLKPSLRVGYFSVTLYINSKGSCKRVHCLVAQAFLGDRPHGFDVNHIDGNKLNNLPSNLEYCTRSQNSRHAFDIGLRFPANGEDSPRSKVTDAQVREIRRTYALGGFSHRQLAKIHGIDHCTVGQIIRRQTWSHIH